jgi:hypothetical protein
MTQRLIVVTVLPAPCATASRQRAAHARLSVTSLGQHLHQTGQAATTDVRRVAVQAAPRRSAQRARRVVTAAVGKAAASRVDRAAGLAASTARCSARTASAVALRASRHTLLQATLRGCPRSVLSGHCRGPTARVAAPVEEQQATRRSRGSDRRRQRRTALPCQVCACVFVFVCHAP